MKNIGAGGAFILLLLVFGLATVLSGCSVITQRGAEATTTVDRPLIAEPGATASSWQGTIAAPTPDASPTIVPTSTPRATTTPVPTPTVGVTLENVVEVAPGALPPTTHDLLYMNGSELWMWRHDTGAVEMLATSVLAYEVVSEERSKVVILRSTPQETTSWQLAMVDTRRKQEQLLGSGDGEMVAFAVAPDGLSVAYVIGEREPQGHQPRAVEAIYVLELAQQETIVAGQCETEVKIPQRRYAYFLPCGPVVWTPDSRFLLWGDGVGVWQVAIGGEPVLLVANEIYEDDAPLLYKPTRQWSPDGHSFLLSGYRAGGSRLFVYEYNSNNRVIEVPRSVSGMGEFAYWLWSADGRLFTVRGPDYSAGEREAMGELWRVDDQTLVRDASAILPGDGLGSPASPAQFSDDRFAFVLNGNNLPEAQGLYVLPSFDEQAQMIAPLPQVPNASPPYGQSVVWAPDGSGVVVAQADPGTEMMQYVIYTSTDGEPAYELRPALGTALHSFTWIP